MKQKELNKILEIIGAYGNIYNLTIDSFDIPEDKKKDVKLAFAYSIGFMVSGIAELNSGLTIPESVTHFVEKMERDNTKR